MTKLESYRKDFSTVYKLTIDDVDRIKLRLDRFDTLLVEECDGPTASLSDRLLGLETIVRRMGEQR
jgi:hypothetical protein